MELIKRECYATNEFNPNSVICVSCEYFNDCNEDRGN